MLSLVPSKSQRQGFNEGYAPNRGPVQASPLQQGVNDDLDLIATDVCLETSTSEAYQFGVFFAETAPQSAGLAQRCY